MRTSRTACMAWSFQRADFPRQLWHPGASLAAGPRPLTSINAGPTHLVPQRLRRNPNRRATQATAPLDSPLSPRSVPGHPRAALHQLQRVLTRRRHALILSKVRVSIGPFSGHHGLRWPAPRSIGRQKAYAAGQPARRVCRCGTSQLRAMGALVAVLVVFAHDRLQSLQITSVVDLLKTLRTNGPELLVTDRKRVPDHAPPGRKQPA
jgi:hypothetical protein